MDVQELLARAWIDCDPNRETGTGDDTLDFGTMKGAPRWRWFVPRADALAAYIDQHGGHHDRDWTG